MTTLYRYDIYENFGRPSEFVRSSVIGVDQERARIYAVREALIWSGNASSVGNTSVVFHAEYGLQEVYVPRT